MPAIEAAGSELLEQIQGARAQSDRLFEVLRPEAIYERPIAERHRVIFYIGHLEAFDYIQICREGLGIPSRGPQLDTLFQAGIDPDSGHLPSDTPRDWPSMETVRSYVDRCRREVDENLDRAPEESVVMALEHRDMHVETLAYMFHNFPYELKRGPNSSRLDAPSFATDENEWCDIPSGEAVLGKKEDGSFGWDNEYEQVRRTIPAFRIQRYNVTNGDYLRFVEEGAPMPHFWTRRGDAIYYRGMFREIPLPLDWPVYVTQVEAEAYAKALGKSLPSEEQFDRAAYGNPWGEERKYPWGKGAPTAERGNFDFEGWDPDCISEIMGSSVRMDLRIVAWDPVT